nr:venom protein [Lampona murina]
MKIVLLFAFIIAVVHFAETSAEEIDAALVDLKDEETERGDCLGIGVDCTSHCQCCSKYTYCSKVFGGVFGRSCVFGDTEWCKQKKRDCAGSGWKIVNDPPGYC